MRLNFFRRLRITPNVWLNLSRSGTSVSTGVRGLRFTFGRGRTKVTAGLPGTGLSVTEDFGSSRRRLSQSTSTTSPGETTGARLLNKALSGK